MRKHDSLFAGFALLLLLPGHVVAQSQLPNDSNYLGAPAQASDRMEAEPFDLFDGQNFGAVNETVSEPSRDPAALRGLDVGAIAILGLHAMSPGDFADVIATCIGRPMDREDLVTMTNAIARRAQAEGFAFATASIAPQRLRNGVIAVQVDEGTIDEIRIEGAEHRGVREALAPLASGKPVRIAELERRLLIADDIDGVRVTGRRYLRENGRGVLVVMVAHDRFAARAVMANEGTRAVGREQLTLSADINSVLASDDSITLTWSGTPAEPDELQFGRIRYEKRISRTGTEVILVGSMAMTRPGAYLTPLQIKSRSWQAGLSLLQPLKRRRHRSLWFQADLNLRDLHQTLRGATSREERIVTARGSLYGFMGLAGGRLSNGLTLTQGVGLLGASDAGNPLASRLDADGTFTTLGFWSDWSGSLAGSLGLRIAMQGQLAFQPLPVSEELGLGGSGYLRGYDWFERSGDEGVMGLAELRYNFDQPVTAVRRAEVYTFIDGGSVGNRDGGFGGGTLASGGGGIRLDFTRRFGAGLEVAVPLTGERYDTGNRSSKINFRLNGNF